MLRERKQGAKHTVPLVSAGMARVTASPKGTHPCSGVQAWKPTLHDCPLGTCRSQLKSYEILEVLAGEPQDRRTP